MPYIIFRGLHQKTNKKPWLINRDKRNSIKNYFIVIGIRYCVYFFSIDPNHRRVPEKEKPWSGLISMVFYVLYIKQFC